jgi:DNA polymerase-3 subunit epsilon
LPKSWKASVTDLNNWPRLVQIAFLLYDNDGNLMSPGDFLIKPNRFTIPTDASRIHGVTTDRANREGHAITTVLQEFDNHISKANYLIAHNMSFDEKIVGAEFLCNKMQNSIATRRKICQWKEAWIFAELTGNTAMTRIKVFLFPL